MSELGSTCWFFLAIIFIAKESVASGFFSFFQVVLRPSPRERWTVSIIKWIYLSLCRDEETSSRNNLPSDFTNWAQDSLYNWSRSGRCIITRVDVSGFMWHYHLSTAPMIVRPSHGGPNDSGIDSLSTGPLARPFARSLAPDCSLRSRPPLRSLAHFTHSLARGKVNF